VTNYLELFQSIWNKNKQAQIYDTGFQDTDVRAGGRATKEYPNKEDEQWWLNNGSQMVEAWVRWRDNSGWGIADLGEGKPAIEVGIEASIGGIPVKMFIDRIMVIPSETGVLTRDNFVVLDLKSGKSAPKSDLQLALYATGIELAFGWRPRWGTYWMARTGETSPVIDLDLYPKEMFEDIFGKFKTARDNGVFLPNLNHCVMCSVVEFCKYRQPDLWEKDKK
jgi:hypothetical protein